MVIKPGVRITRASIIVLVALAVAACGDDAASRGEGGTAGASPAPATSGEGGGTGGDGNAQSSGATTAGTGGESAGGGGGSGGGDVTTGGEGGSTSSSGGGTSVDDPDVDGPYATAETTDVIAATDGSDMPIFAAYPTAGPEAGPYPVIVIGHGFQIPAAQYASYVRRLATHGFVALTADFPTSFFGVSNVDNAADLLASLDWAASAPALAGRADTERAGMTGHSLGGKLALLAASIDPRIQATITLDPVDGSMGCAPEDCPDVSDLMPLSIPTGFVGETTDAQGSFQACAPAADNYATFYAGTLAPSLEVTVLGANHMSFLDDVAGCGFTCSFCNDATVEDAVVGALSRAYVVAFYRRWLKGEADYDAYLTGAQAQARYVTTGLATIQSK